MNTYRTISSVTRCLLVASALLLNDAAAIAGDKQEDPQVAALPAKLTSKNRKPIIKRSEGGEKPTVVITKDFSWDEQTRVQGAIRQLAKNPTAELLTQLIRLRYCHDYCISTINDNESIWNKDVGDVARELSDEIVEIPVRIAFEDVLVDDTNPFKKGLQVYDDVKIPNIDKLLNEDHLELYQVQLKFLEANKAALQKKYPDDKLAAEVILKIDAARKTIGDNKKPMLQAIEYPIREEYFDESESSRAKVILPSPPK